MTVSRCCPEGKVVLLVLDSTSTSMVSPRVLFIPKTSSAIGAENVPK